MYLDTSVWVCVHPSCLSFWIWGIICLGWCVGALAPLPLLLWVWGIICLEAGVWVHLHPSHSSFGSGGLFLLTPVCGCACTPPAHLLICGIICFVAGVWVPLAPPVCLPCLNTGVWVQSCIFIYMLTIYFYSNSNHNICYLHFEHEGKCIYPISY